MRAHFARTSLLFSILGGPTASGQVYHAVEMPMLPGGTAASARAINESGVVVGESNTSLPGYPEAVVWLEDGPLNLGGSGFSGSISMDINESGLVVGVIDEIGAFTWVSADPFSIGPAFFFAFASAVNDASVIVGGMHKSAAIWQDGRSTELPTFLDCCGSAHDINNAGVIVGEVVNAELHTVAVRWVDGAIQVVADTDYNAIAHAINEAGTIVGELTEFPEPGEPWVTRAFVWNGASAIELPSFGGLQTRAYAINNQGDIVGSSTVDDLSLAPHAFIWRDGEVLDLNDLVVSGERNYILAVAYDINDAGQIVGVTEDMRAFRLDPIIETPGDLDGDQSVGFSDLLILLAAWGECAESESCPADFDESGNVGFEDLLTLLANWS